MQLAGKPAKQYLDEFMGTPEWRSMSDGERREEVREVLSEFRAAGRDALLERYPKLEMGAIPPPPSGFEVTR